MINLALPTLAMMIVAGGFLALERIAPGRELPHAPGWYGRAILINFVQAAITFVTNELWLNLLSGASLFHLAKLESSVLQAALILYPLLGCTLEGALWFNFFAAAGELFYHTNVKTPHWVKYFIQTPELHSIHHQLDVHHYNFADLPLWDRLFGNYRDADLRRVAAFRCARPCLPSANHW